MTWRLKCDVTAYIKNIETGEIRQYMTDIPYEDGEPVIYIWQDGNFSCDCNRELFFACANNENDEDLNGPCGETRFKVNLVNPIDGNVFYREFE